MPRLLYSESRLPAHISVLKALRRSTSSEQTVAVIQVASPRTQVCQAPIQVDKASIKVGKIPIQVGQTPIRVGKASSHVGKAPISAFLDCILLSKLAGLNENKVLAA
jgi:hypothetical protein